MIEWVHFHIISKLPYLFIKNFLIFSNYNINFLSCSGSRCILSCKISFNKWAHWFIAKAIEQFWENNNAMSKYSSRLRFYQIICTIKTPLVVMRPISISMTSACVYISRLLLRFLSLFFSSMMLTTVKNIIMK